MSDRNHDTEADLWVVYDGQCPFSSSFVQLYRIREHAKQVHLVDARTPHPILAEIHERQFDLDDGMVVKLGDRFYHGAAAMQFLAILGSDDTVFNRLNRLLFRHPWLARRLYPLLVAGRLTTLRLLGRTKIGAI